MRCNNIFLSFETYDPSSASTKVHASSGLSPENVQYNKALGVVCSTLGLLPTPLVLSGLQELGEKPNGSGGLTDVWRGKDSGNALVAMKTFVGLSSEQLKKAKEVSKNKKVRSGWRTNFTDLLEIGTGVEETRPPEYPTISRRQHFTIWTCSCLRLV